MRHKLPFCVGKPTPQVPRKKSQFMLFKIHPPKALPRVASVFQAGCFCSDFSCVLKKYLQNNVLVFILKEKTVATGECHMFVQQVNLN